MKCRVIDRAMAITLALIMSGVLYACQKTKELVLFERNSVSRGEFRGLKIGATKSEALDAIRALGVYAVHPYPAVKFRVTSENPEDLTKIIEAEGIRVTDPRGLEIDLFFDRGGVTSVRRSVPAKGNTWFHEGERMKDVVDKLHQLIREGQELEVFPIVQFEGDGWTELKKPPADVLRSLQRYQAWTFELNNDKPVGAFMEVYFQNERLSRIEYRRLRFAVE